MPKFYSTSAHSTEINKLNSFFYSSNNVDFVETKLNKFCRFSKEAKNSKNVRIHLFSLFRSDKINWKKKIIKCKYYFTFWSFWKSIFLFWKPILEIENNLQSSKYNKKDIQPILTLKFVIESKYNNNFSYTCWFLEKLNKNQNYWPMWLFAILLNSFSESFSLFPSMDILHEPLSFNFCLHFLKPKNLLSAKINRSWTWA